MWRSCVPSSPKRRSLRRDRPPAVGCAQKPCDPSPPNSLFSIVFICRETQRANCRLKCPVARRRGGIKKTGRGISDFHGLVDFTLCGGTPRGRFRVAYRKRKSSLKSYSHG